jgi:hypothetical protein
MTTTMNPDGTTMAAQESALLARLLREGYGDGAWHGPDLKAALADVDARRAFSRVAPRRHNIAEIAIHHAYYLRSVRERLAGTPQLPFLLEGDDWFLLDAGGPLSWADILSVISREHQALASLIDDIGRGRVQPALTPAERLDLVLGITCHAVYHAGQIQLVKRLLE